MRINRKLTKLIAGRKVGSIEHNDNLLQISFQDGSSMKVKTAMSEPILKLPSSAVKMTRQKDNVLNIVFADDSSVEIKLAEVGSSVMLRDAKSIMEYAD